MVFDINKAVEKVDIAESLPEGRYTGTIAKIESKSIEFADKPGEIKERLQWTFVTPDGKEARGFTGFVAAPKSGLLDLMINLDGLGKPLSSQIGRKVSFTVRKTATGRSAVSMGTVTPI